MEVRSDRLNEEPNNTPHTNTDTLNGLSTEEAKKRLAENGHNEVPEKKPNPILGFAYKF
jgi:hypothetical protein